MTLGDDRKVELCLLLGPSLSLLSQRWLFGHDLAAKKRLWPLVSPRC